MTCAAMRTLVVEGPIDDVASMLDSRLAAARMDGVLARVDRRHPDDFRWQAFLSSGAPATTYLTAAVDDRSVKPGSVFVNCSVDRLGPDDQPNALFAFLRSLPFTEEEMRQVRCDLPITAGYSAAVRDRPLAGTGIIFTIHHMRDFLVVVEQLLALGAPPELLTVIDKQYPYAHSSRVDAHLKQRLGIEVWPYSELAEGIRRHVKRVEAAGARSIIMDDGGYVYPTVCRELAETRDHWLGIVEQTMSGIWKLDGLDLPLPVFSVAESELKGAIESYGVADASVRNVLRLLPEEKFEGQAALVIGYGRIGGQLASILRSRRMRVAVYDREITRLLTAHEDGFTTRRRLPDLCRAHRPRLVLGSAGRQSIAVADLAAAGNDLFLASTTSRDYEFPLAELTDAATEVTDLGVLGKAYRLQTGQVVTVIADGMPVNFHHAESLPNRYVDIVMASLIVGALAVGQPDSPLLPGHNVATTNSLLVASGIVDSYYSLYGPSDG